MEERDEKMANKRRGVFMGNFWYQKSFPRYASLIFCITERWTEVVIAPKEEDKKGKKTIQSYGSRYVFMLDSKL